MAVGHTEHSHTIIFLLLLVGHLLVAYQLDFHLLTSIQTLLLPVNTSYFLTAVIAVSHRSSIIDLNIFYGINYRYTETEVIFPAHAFYTYQGFTIREELFAFTEYTIFHFSNFTVRHPEIYAQVRCLWLVSSRSPDPLGTLQICT